MPPNRLFLNAFGKIGKPAKLTSLALLAQDVGGKQVKHAKYADSIALLLGFVTVKGDLHLLSRRTRHSANFREGMTPDRTIDGGFGITKGAKANS